MLVNIKINSKVFYTLTSKTKLEDEFLQFLSFKEKMKTLDTRLTVQLIKQLKEK